MSTQMLVALYRSKPHEHQAPGGYWFLRVVNPVTGLAEETALTERKAANFMALGVPRLEDGGGL